ncbi:hypothetical protein OPQ81_006180 [Rhizoctonia solani]|nr:hypothetical protein OPQ81_006180 [Rhizoctonia solani]
MCTPDFVPGVDDTFSCLGSEPGGGVVEKWGGFGGGSQLGKFVSLLIAFETFVAWDPFDFDVSIQAVGKELVDCLMEDFRGILGWVWHKGADGLYGGLVVAEYGDVVNIEFVGKQASFVDAGG